jgi:hypothetical protein
MHRLIGEAEPIIRAQTDDYIDTQFNGPVNISDAMEERKRHDPEGACEGEGIGKSEEAEKQA